MAFARSFAGIAANACTSNSLMQLMSESRQSRKLRSLGNGCGMNGSRPNFALNPGALCQRRRAPSASNEKDTPVLSNRLRQRWYRANSPAVAGCYGRL